MYKILTLDGGGAKGIYSLGVLFEVENRLGAPLSNHFDYFYGCSTGALIAAALALGKTTAELKDLYIKRIPDVMRCYTAGQRTKKLKDVLEEEFKGKKFDAFIKDVGIVASCVEEKRPKIFKSNLSAAHGRKATFNEGFGCTIAEALLASCSAKPFFKDVKLYDPKNKTHFTCRDGGFCANNPTLFAVVDALKAMKIAKEELIVLNIGTGDFSNSINLYSFFSGFKHGFSVNLIFDIFDMSSNTNDQVVKFLFNDVKILRISEADPSLNTSILESNIDVLEKLFGRGRKSFENAEKQFMNFFPEAYKDEAK
jgi:patatin-like phospholipase/acyl hydrolase